MTRLTGLYEGENKIILIAFNVTEDGRTAKAVLLVKAGKYNNQTKWLDIDSCYFKYFLDTEYSDDDDNPPECITEEDFNEIYQRDKNAIHTIDEEELPGILESLELLYGIEDDQRTKNPSIC